MARYFQDYLDPGFKTASNFEEFDKPSFEHFLAQPSTLTDHLLWQLGSLNLTVEARAAAELIIGNLDSNGYLTVSDEEMAEALEAELAAVRLAAMRAEPIPFERGRRGVVVEVLAQDEAVETDVSETKSFDSQRTGSGAPGCLGAVVEARQLIHQLDPLGVAARDLRECLLIQVRTQRNESYEGIGAAQMRDDDVFVVAEHIVSKCLALLQKKDMRELTRSCARNAEQVQEAVEYIRTLDPRPGQRYNVGETRLIEPDVAFVKRDDEFVVVMNEEDMPTLRLSGSYRRMMRQKETEKEVREYVKERYKSAIQLLRNIEQRKNTIVRTCEAIVRRQGDFLERGEEALRPMMIKEVAEEIGVHPSTVSRAVANKYVHTAQGVYELRFFFSEGVNGPEGGDLPLVLLKRKVKKLIEEEDPRKPLTDDHLAAALKDQGINVTRRTVAKYREDMQIPSTHQRRVR